MPLWLIALYLVHAAAGLTWLGSSFLVAQAKGKGAETQFPLQMIAALIAFAVGGTLWSKLHPYGIGKQEAVLALGAALAVAAAGVQGVLVGGGLRRLRAGALEEDARRRIYRGERYGAILLALAFFAMMLSYHV